jgi:Na+/H+-dicarboxylate symporter
MKRNLWKKVLIGMLLGVLCGYLFRDHFLIFKPFAIIYTNMVKMIVVPTVFFAILFGMTHISDIHTLGRIGIRSVVIYGFATVLAVGIGIALTLFFEPGLDVSLLGTTAQDINNIITPHHKRISDIILDIIPTNPVSAMATGHTLQVAVFAFFLGLALILVGDKGDDARKIIVSITHVIFKMVELVIKTTPYGVFAIMAWIVGEYGFSLVLSLGKLIFVIMAGFALQYIIFGIMILLTKLRPLQFYKKTIHVQTLALATSSTKATITSAIHDLQKAGVSKRVASFVLPLGASTNMSGTAIYISACAIFFAQVVGIKLTGSQYIILILTSTIGSIGAAGYPGGGVIMLSMVLSSLGLPLEGIPIILGIDRFIDMFRTVINVTGDCAVTVMVDKLNGTLDMKKYNSE